MVQKKIICKKKSVGGEEKNTLKKKKKGGGGGGGDTCAELLQRIGKGRDAFRSRKIMKPRFIIKTH